MIENAISRVLYQPGDIYCICGHCLNVTTLPAFGLVRFTLLCCVLCVVDLFFIFWHKFGLSHSRKILRDNG